MVYLSGLHVIYRTNGADKSGKCRPSFFSKYECLASLLVAYESVNHPKRFLCIADGDCDEERIDLASRFGPVKRLPGVGNSKALREALVVAVTESKPSDLVLFAEDDYLYCPGALEILFRGASRISSAHYFTLYDHPDRYRRSDDWGKRHERVWFDGANHWRQSESTTESYAVLAAQLDRDLAVHRLASVGSIPKDRLKWRILGGYGPFSLLPWRRRLASALPGLASHVEEDQMMPGAWSELSQRSRKDIHSLLNDDPTGSFRN